MICDICRHERQAEIDNAILSVNGDTITLEKIAEEYELDLNKLKVHALMHLNPISGRCDTSLVEQIKVREAETLRNVYSEYYTTLKKLGLHINKCILNAEGKELPLDRLLAKSTIDLYLGAGLQVRETIESIIALDKAVNKDKDNGLDVIKDLVKAVRS